MNISSLASPLPVERIAYSGPEEFRSRLMDALCQVIDPELAMTIVDVGLVYGVTLVDDEVRVRLTMTSAACPVADVIIEDILDELSQILPSEMTIATDLVWEPEWTPDRMSDRAKKAMGW